MQSWNLLLKKGGMIYCFHQRRLNATCINHSIMFLTDPSAKEGPSLALWTDLGGVLADRRCLSRKSVLFARSLFRTAKWGVWSPAPCVHCPAAIINKEQVQPVQTRDRSNVDILKKTTFNQLACVSIYWVRKWIYKEWLGRATDMWQTETHTHARTRAPRDNTWPYRSRASLTSSFALEWVVARTLL